MSKYRLNDSYVIIIVWLVLALFLCARVSSAQAPVETLFSAGCMEWPDSNTYRIHFGYTSVAVEQFVTTFDLPPATTPYISLPPTFTTVPGVHENEWYLEADTTDAVLTYNIIFENGYSTHILHLSNWTAELCAWQPTATPPGVPLKPATSLFLAFNSATGTFYPYAPVASGIVPLPATGG